MRQIRANAPSRSIGSQPLATRLPLAGRRVLVTTVALTMIGAIGAGYMILTGRNAEGPTPRPTPALTVTVATPKPVVWPDVVTASGAIAPWQEASIGTQIGSYRLVEVRVDVGDHVRRGQVLARLNPALLRAEEAQLLARHEQAQANSRRAQALKASGGVSEQDVLAAETEARAASALLAAKRLELRYTAILAPDDGVITARLATLGAVAPAGQELFRMIRQDRLEWRGELTAAQLMAVAGGQAISLTLPDGSLARARVRQTAPAMDASSRLAVVYADIAPGSRARAGMYASGAIAAGASPGLVAPAESVVIRDGRSFVMVLDEGLTPPTIRRRAVRTGRRSEGLVEIVDGLAGRERLVVRGAGFLDDGDVVRVSHDRGGAR